MATFASFAPRRMLLSALLATALAAHGAPGDVVISQLYGASNNGGGQWSHDFVELFNRGADPARLHGMSLQYQSATGSGWGSVTALPDVTLAPGQYFLVLGRHGGGPNPVGEGDFANNGLDLAGTAGKVALVHGRAPMTTPQGANLADLVGFGGANRFEGAPAPAPSAVNAIQRLGRGCQDSDNNRDDFIAAPVDGPRNTRTPLASCAGADPGPAPVIAPVVASCPAVLQVGQGGAVSARLSARDADSRVTHAAIVAGAVAGIGLADFTPSDAIGGEASVRLRVNGAPAGILPGGRHPVQVEFANTEGDTGRCDVSIDVAGQLSIPAIQGTGPASAYAGTVQTTQGVITARVGTGFFIQDPHGDGDPSTSDGLYVYGTPTMLPIGTLVRVTGMVEEYRPTGASRSYTELKDVSAIVDLGAGPALAPANIALPNANPADVEGMLVRFTTPLTVNGNRHLGERGELVLANGRREHPANRHRPGSLDAAALYRAHAINQIVLDDGIFVAPESIPYLADDGTVRVGDTVHDLTGIVDYGALGGGGAGFKLQPTVTPTFIRSNERPPAPRLPGAIKVASMNVLNFFTTFTNGRDAWGRSGQGCTVGKRTSPSECRGADNMPEFVRQRDKIVAALAELDADVVGLMEIQNNGDVALAYLVDQLNVATAPGTYAMVPRPAALGTDAIRVAMLYKPARLGLAGPSLSDDHDINNRPPMAQTFRTKAGGERFSVIVNHLKSKGGCSGAGAGDTDPGNGAGCWDRTRTGQARRLSGFFIPQVVAAAQDPDVLVIGDLNAYAFESPIEHLTQEAGMVNLLERFVRPHGMPYSYVFDGLSGYLDHALASASLAPQVAGAAEWHSNADEPETIDYNLNDTAQDPYRKNAYRASDHDPLVVSLDLGGGYADVTASARIVIGGLSITRGSGKVAGSVTITNTSGQPLHGPLHLVLRGLPPGVTLDHPAGLHEGAPYVTVAQADFAPGATVSVATSFSAGARRQFSYTPQLLSGALQEPEQPRADGFAGNLMR